MTHSAMARDALALLCAAQGLATVAIDMNRTHATNPVWPAHARFHVVWQTASTALLALIELALVLVHGPLQDERFYLAAALAAIPIVGFFAALISRRMYGGALFDPNGIPPLRFHVAHRLLQVDLNLAAVIAGLAALAAIVVLNRV